MCEVVEEIRKLPAQAEVEALRALKQIYEKAYSHTAAIGLMERLCQLEPDSNEDRFSLAYMHSEHGSKNLSVYHYTMIPERERSAIAYNNLGVAYSEFRLTARAVSSFRKAKEMEETLAISNLAFRYIDAGFLDDAKLLCDEAMKLPNHNNRINHVANPPLQNEMSR